MLTKEQKKIIREATKKGAGCADSILQGITYDEMKDVEDVKAAANGEKDNDSGAYVVFSPINKRGAEFWFFNSVEDMCKKLYQKYNSEKYQGDIAISEKTFETMNMENLQKVYLLKAEKSYYSIVDTIGFCDCKTFKRG